MAAVIGPGWRGVTSRMAAFGGGAGAEGVAVLATAGPAAGVEDAGGVEALVTRSVDGESRRGSSVEGRGTACVVDVDREESRDAVR